MATDDRADVERAVDGFFAALNAMFKGELEPMKEVWSHADDVTYLGPVGGVLVGWDAVLKSWEKQAAMNLGGEVHPVGTRIFLGGDLAAVQCLGQGENMPGGEGAAVNVRGTSLYRKEDRAWKMISHHMDPLPYLAA